MFHNNEVYINPAYARILDQSNPPCAVILFYGNHITALIVAGTNNILVITNNIFKLLCLASVMNTVVVGVQRRVTVAPGCDMKAVIMKAK